MQVKKNDDKIIFVDAGKKKDDNIIFVDAGKKNDGNIRRLNSVTFNK
jgi:hypothetical protein